MVRFPKAYTMVIDEQVKAMAIKDISTCGADEFVAKACAKFFHNPCTFSLFLEKYI